MFTYAVMFLGGTEAADCTNERLYNYARRCVKAGYNPTRVRVCVWPLSDFVRAARRFEPEITVEEVKARQEQLGYRFVDTRELAKDAGHELAARCEKVITEVFDTTKRKRALCANPNQPKRRAA